MAALEAASVTVRVVPDMSAFRLAEAHEIVSAIAADHPALTLDDLLAVAATVVQHFSCLPK